MVVKLRVISDIETTDSISSEKKELNLLFFRVLLIDANLLHSLDKTMLVEFRIAKLKLRAFFKELSWLAVFSKEDLETFEKLSRVNFKQFD